MLFVELFFVLVWLLTLSDFLRHSNILILTMPTELTKLKLKNLQDVVRTSKTLQSSWREMLPHHTFSCLASYFNEFITTIFSYYTKRFLYYQFIFLIYYYFGVQMIVVLPFFFCSSWNDFKKGVNNRQKHSRIDWVHK